MTTINIYMHPELGSLLVGVLIFVAIKTVIEMIP